MPEGCRLIAEVTEDGMWRVEYSGPDADADMYDGEGTGPELVAAVLAAVRDADGLEDEDQEEAPAEWPWNRREPAPEPGRDESPAESVTESAPAADGADAQDDAQDDAERERAADEAAWRARLRPVEGLSGYSMAEWPGTGRYHLAWDRTGERIGHAERSGWGRSGWEAHGRYGTLLQDGLRTRAEALLRVAAVHERRTEDQARPAPGLPDGWTLVRTLAEARAGEVRLVDPAGTVAGSIRRDSSGSRARWTATAGDPAAGRYYNAAPVWPDDADPDRADGDSWWTRTAAVRALARHHAPDLDASPAVCGHTVGVDWMTLTCGDPAGHSGAHHGLDPWGHRRTWTEVGPDGAGVTDLEGRPLIRGTLPPSQARPRTP
ncbi:hypothetical protein [Actinomadura logoneensis]|uniref:hypothetical protein n=1 Tax=Actinomadura logoneensis TaxID=2293572 RepID=UPI0013146DF3|nr:hypothetical protein [Actinomadura logoneensis]